VTEPVVLYHALQTCPLLLRMFPKVSCLANMPLLSHHLLVVARAGIEAAPVVALLSAVASPTSKCRA
jgi:hypothetical protein